jgi:hypothetical protein
LISVHRNDIKTLKNILIWRKKILIFFKILLKHKNKHGKKPSNINVLYKPPLCAYGFNIANTNLEIYPGQLAIYQEMMIESYFFIIFWYILKLIWVFFHMIINIYFILFFFFIICIEKAIGFGDELFSVNDESNSFHLLFSDISLIWLELRGSMWSKSIRTSYLLIKKNWLWIWVDLWF